ncbi:MAG: hypothetical protein ACI9FJ_000839 [Alteromonadaceae bacterium]|jgi:hypothetical protein
METVFSHAIKSADAIWVKGFDDPDWKVLINKPIHNIAKPDSTMQLRV